MSKYSSRSFNQAISSCYNVALLRQNMPKVEDKKESTGLLTKKQVSEPSSMEKEPIYRVAKHVEAIEQFRKEKV